MMSMSIVGTASVRFIYTDALLLRREAEGVGNQMDQFPTSVLMVIGFALIRFFCTYKVDRSQAYEMEGAFYGVTVHICCFCCSDSGRRTRGEMAAGRLSVLKGELLWLTETSCFEILSHVY
jgi:hypothetical protein